MKINKRGLDAELGKQLAPILRTRVNRKLIAAAREVEQILLKEFEDHQVTRELRQKKNGSNISGTLGGYGNLFTYIGFNDSDDPIEIIRSLLANSIQVTMLPAKSKKMIQEAIVSLPSKAEIEKATPLPWASGRSWVKGIEEGISGLGNYLSTQSRASGRSGGGIQTEKNIRGRRFISVNYLSEILNNLRKNISRALRK